MILFVDVVSMGGKDEEEERVGVNMGEEWEGERFWLGGRVDDGRNMRDEKSVVMGIM